MMPRPTWRWFLGRYLRLCVAAILFLVVLMGVPAVAILSIWWPR